MAEDHHMPVFRLVPHFPPAWMVAVLPPSPDILARGLQVPLRIGADPDAPVGRRNGELADTVQRGRVPDDLAGGIAIDIALRGGRPADPRRSIIDVMQVGRFGRTRDTAIDGEQAFQTGAAPGSLAWGAVLCF